MLATGYDKFNEILRKHFKSSSKADSFYLLEQEVIHRNYLKEIIEEQKPDIVIVHDYHLASSFDTQEEQQQEWIDLIDETRIQFDDAIRFVFICERKNSDPFLKRLVQSNVLDIFTDRVLDLYGIIEQLADGPKFARVAKYTKGAKYAEEAVLEVEDEERGAQGEQEQADEDIEEKNHFVKLPKIIGFKKKKSKAKTKQDKEPEEKAEEKEVNEQEVKQTFKLNVVHNTPQHIGVTIERKLILIGGPYSRSGSTFIAHLLAKALANYGVPPAYIESPYQRPYTYDRFFGEKNAPDYISYFNAFTSSTDNTDIFTPLGEQSYERNHVWEHEGVRLVTKHPLDEPIYTEEEINFESFARLILSLHKTPFIIVDVGTDWTRKTVQKLYDICDHAYMVIEPDLPLVDQLYESSAAAYEYHRQILKHEKTSLIVNKATPKMVGQFADETNFTFPPIHSETIYNSQYEGTIGLHEKGLQDKSEKQLEPILSELLPKQYLSKKKRESGIISKLVRRKINVSKD